MISRQRLEGSIPESRERGGDRRLQVALGELAHGQVDGDPERARVGAQRVPARGLGAGGVEHEAPDRVDQAGLLGDGDEVRRQQAPARGVLPAQQRLDRGDRAIPQRDDRLVDDAQLPAGERAAQVVLDRQALDRARTHRAVEDLKARAPARLGLVHRRVGVADQARGLRALGAGDRDPQRGLREVLAGGELERRLEGGDDPLGHARGRALVGNPIEQDDELVAAEPRDRVAGPQRGLQPRRDLHQQLVAGGVPERVVDELEVVDVEQHDGDLRAGAGERLHEPVLEQRAVGEARERIVDGLVADHLGAALELGLGALAVGDVGDHPVPAQPARGVGRERGFVAHPHGAPVAVAQAVFVGRVRFGEAFLAREDPRAVVGVHLPRPQPGVVDPLSRGEAEDRLRTGGDVEPAALDADLGDVEDRGQLVEQRPDLGLGQTLARASGERAPGGRGRGGGGHPPACIGTGGGEAKAQLR